ncbi:MAG: ABC transporter permease subunit [Thiohalophilus sp.]|uniref:ABC transporter permease n=1 Tax=Thiohalophilus sp. TaxID=3028392 RepID=UPI00286FD397|nr:ABC transporter permease subunit [Thiohalophilus sp.]MDR9436997.1 ABC transporter permease subunit [Thiohalophilus sp.]
MHEIMTVARKEFRDSLRNRWILAITVVLALFALGLAYFGAATAGQVGFVSLDTTIVSLASLAIYIIPLIALLLAYHSVVGEEEQGTLLLLLSYPLTHLQLLGGKFLGHAAALAISTIAGFGLAGIVIATLSGNFSALDLWSSLGWFILTSVLLGWVFIAIAYLISTLVSEKSRAAGLALIVWFLFVLVFDLGLLGLLVASDGAVSSDLFPYLLLLNPTDVFRLANLAGFEATQAYSGLVSVASAQLFRPGLLAGILLLWVIVPFSVAAWLFHKRIS